MTKICFAVSSFLTFCSVSFLAGCQTQQPWHLSAHKEKDTVQLCLSHEPACPQPNGVSLGDISVYRYDSEKDNQLVWDVSPETSDANDRFDGIVTYGIPPKNWGNKITPEPLVCGKAYLVNPPAVFFGLKCDGTVVVFDFPQLESFFRPAAPPVPSKKGAGS